MDKRRHIDARHLWRGKPSSESQDETQNKSDWVFGALCQNEKRAIYNPNDHSKTPIIRETAGQCACVTDVNSALIYEGDIVTGFSTGCGQQVGYVKYSQEKPTFEVVFKKYKVEIRFVGKIEVVGNIYDNPELLDNNDESQEPGEELKGEKAHD